MIFRPAVLVLSCLMLAPYAVQSATPEMKSAAEPESQFGFSETLFATMAALNSAGYDDGLNSSLGQHFQIRKQVREEIAKKNVESLAELKAFYQAHRKNSGGAELGQYISFALLASGPPFFELPTGDLPPDVAGVKDFAPLLARFYKEADLETLWKRAQPAYVSAIGEYQDPVINSIFEANGYVRNSSGYLGRRFQVYLDLMGEPNQIQVRSYRDDYYVVITPTSTPVVDEIRDAYLAYLLDPLSFKYRVLIEERSSLEKVAQDAPLLDPAYKHDFSLLVTKSLIKAIDSRLIRGDADKRTAYVNQAMREGFILTETFANLLSTYEKQPESMRDYYPDLISAVDAKKEQKRLRDYEFAKTEAPRVVAPAAQRQGMNAAEETLESAEGLYEQEQYEDAKKLYKKVFEQTADKQLHGRAYYRLGLIAVRENHKDEAVQMFQRTVEANPEPALTAWSHVYLARLAQAAGDSDKADEQFKLALNVEGASPAARQAAEKGLQSSSTGEKKQ